MPLAVVTVTVPVVAPVGTLVSIADAVTLSSVALVPLKATLVVPARLFPRIMTLDPTLPAVVTVFTNGPRPIDRLKTVPSKVAPPPRAVVP